MERAHRFRLRQMFHDHRSLPRMARLNIPDHYHYMDPELVELIKEATETVLEQEDLG